MTEEERKLALYCLKANSDYHSEVCEECVNYPNCDHTIQDDVMETVIKALEQEYCDDVISRQSVKELFQDAEMSGEYSFLGIDNLPPVTPYPCEEKVEVNT